MLTEREIVRNFDLEPTKAAEYERRLKKIEDSKYDSGLIDAGDLIAHTAHISNVYKEWGKLTAFVKGYIAILNVEFEQWQSREYNRLKELLNRERRKSDKNPVREADIRAAMKDGEDYRKYAMILAKWQYMDYYCEYAGLRTAEKSLNACGYLQKIVKAAEYVYSKRGE